MMIRGVHGRIRLLMLFPTHQPVYSIQTLLEVADRKETCNSVPSDFSISCNKSVLRERERLNLRRRILKFQRTSHSDKHTTSNKIAPLPHLLIIPIQSLNEKQIFKCMSILESFMFKSPQGFTT